MGLMVLAGLCFVAFTSTVKTLGDGVPAQQGAFLRFAFGLVFVLPALPALVKSWPEPPVLRLILLRGAIHTVAVITWFYAMARLPLAEVTAMNYLMPVYVTLGAAVVLGEPLRRYRMFALGVAVVGAFVLLRPGFRELGTAHLVMLAASLSLAGSYVVAKFLTGRLPPAVIVAWMSAVVTVILAPLAWSVWVPLTGNEYALLAASAAFATAGHYAMTLAFRAAPVAVTQPMVFLQLIWAVLLGALVFGEPIDPFVILGGALIVSAVSYAAWKENMTRISEDFNRI